MWAALEDIPGQAAVAAQWRLNLGERFAPAQSPFLRPRAERARSVPRYGPGGAVTTYRVVEHGPDDFVGIREEEDRISLTVSDLVVYELDWTALVSPLAAALKLDPYTGPPTQTRQVRRIAEYGIAAGSRLPIHLGFPLEADTLHAAAAELVADHDRPFLLLAGTRRRFTPRTERLLNAHGSSFLSLEECVSLASDGRLRGGEAFSSILRRLRPVADEPLSDRAQDVLVAMLDLKAVDSDSRHTTVDISARALGTAGDANSLKAVMADLSTRGLIRSKTGSRGGCWLTEAGRQRAERLRDH